MVEKQPISYFNIPQMVKHHRVLFINTTTFSESYNRLALDGGVFFPYQK